MHDDMYLMGINCHTSSVNLLVGFLRNVCALLARCWLLPPRLAGQIQPGLSWRLLVSLGTTHIGLTGRIV
jgi:hypothetical protein